MRAVRVLLGLVGLGVAAYGVKLLLDLGTANLRATVEWLIGGIVLHDAVLAPSTVLVGFVLLRLGRGTRWMAPVLVASIVVGTVTIAAVPVLGRWGARPDNTTLLDRPYVLGWGALVAVTAVVTLLAVIVRGRQRP